MRRWFGRRDCGVNWLLRPSNDRVFIATNLVIVKVSF